MIYSISEKEGVTLCQKRKSMNRNSKRNCILKKSSRILRKGNRSDQYQFIDGHKQEFGVRWLLRRMGICPNACYNYRKYRKAGYREQKTQSKNKILQIYHEYSGNPGYRMMRVYLLRAKISLGNTTVLKYMKELGIRSHKCELKQKMPKKYALKEN